MVRERIGLLSSARSRGCLVKVLLLAIFCFALPITITALNHFPCTPDEKAEHVVTVDAGAGSPSLKEVIPAKYQKRYLKWKNDYLSTDAGREEWERYTLDPKFTLTITISREEAEGARVNGLHWDATGKLIAATIMLGSKLDSGYPSSFNYPITCSLAPGNLPSEVKGTILAATKLAHEFGHLNRMMNMDGRLYELQNRLMIEYNRIFHANGLNAQDPRLSELVRRMDGTPVSIAQERESWAEMGAILYLQERLQKDRDAKMPQPIREAISTYYLTYPGRLQ